MNKMCEIRAKLTREVKWCFKLKSIKKNQNKVTNKFREEN